jgi:hypothetical protein
MAVIKIVNSVDPDQLALPSDQDIPCSLLDSLGTLFLAKNLQM